jgi:vacuolar protein sorting-associated protein 26
VIVGKIYFLLVRIKIKTMELSIIRRETTGACKSLHWFMPKQSTKKINVYSLTVPNVYNESETITKFEIMDGAPVRGNYIKSILG